MTSGQFTSFPLSSITVNREERQRRALDPDHIRSLADSISKRGLIHPPVLTRDGTLVVGECRVEALRLLGWTHSPIQFIDELDPRALRAVELEENIRRKQIEWKEECLAVKEYHDLHLVEDQSWTLEQTGEELGYARQAVTDRLQVAKEILSGNARVIAAPKMSTARGIVRRAADRAAGQSAIELSEAFGTRPEPESILTTDFTEWSKTYTGPKFNFIHCDFPYGIGADKFVQGAAPTHGGYDDSENNYWSLIHCLIDNADRLMDDSCHIMFWFSMHYYHDTRRLFSSGNITFDPFPLVWTKSDNIGIIPDPERGPRRIYETAFFGSRGDRKIVSPVSNAAFLPSDRGVHMSVKPVPVLRQFFRMFVDSTTNLLDPTCGSGGALQAAEELGARTVLGLERDEEFAARAREKLKLSRQARKPNDAES